MTALSVPLSKIINIDNIVFIIVLALIYTNVIVRGGVVVYNLHVRYDGHSCGG